MEPIDLDYFESVWGEDLRKEMKSYLLKHSLELLIEEIKNSPKYMGMVKNVCILNDVLYVSVRSSKGIPKDTYTKLMDNVFAQLKTNKTINSLNIVYEVRV